jgi:hypothetical protein
MHVPSIIDSRDRSPGSGPHEGGKAFAQRRVALRGFAPGQRVRPGIFQLAHELISHLKDMRPAQRLPSACTAFRKAVASASYALL